MVKSLPNPELFQPELADFYKEQLIKDKTVIGAVTYEGLIAFGLFRVPGQSGDNMGRDLGINDLNKVVHLELLVLHPYYRGNSMQKLISRTLIDLIIERNYEDICCTVSPKNYYSLNNMISLGFSIRKIKIKFEDKLRCIMHKNVLKQPDSTWQEVVDVDGKNIAIQERLVKDGFEGFALKGTEGNFVISYGKRTS